MVVTSAADPQVGGEPGRVDPGSLPVILYDGGCALCRSSVAWLARRSRGRFRFVASGDVQPEDYGLDRSDLEAWVWFVDPGSPAVAGAAAVSRALRTCRPFWSAFGSCSRCLPSPWRHGSPTAWWPPTGIASTAPVLPGRRASPAA
ncbi:MAG TPA: DUF393 domain-containing protein [Acidimicrobiia bacterium]|nr:DUF393 domain-containing protein [Acidimicrobiia bacterium]